MLQEVLVVFGPRPLMMSRAFNWRKGEDRLMRILIVGAQKSGNVWLMCLLANAYDLRILVDEEKPERPPGLRTFEEWLAGGGFPDGTIYHHHYHYSPEM